MSLHVIARQNRLMRRFREAHATSPRTALPLAEIGVREMHIFRRMLARGIFERAAGESYYMNEDAAAAFMAFRWKAMATAIFVGLLVMLAIVLATRR